MILKNTYKSKIVEVVVNEDFYYATIDNFTDSTDTILKNIESSFVQFYYCTQGSSTFHFSEHYQKILKENMGFVIYNSEQDIPLQLSVAKKSKMHIVAISILKLHLFFKEVNSEISLFNSENQTKFYDEFPLHNNTTNILSQIENYQLGDKYKPLFIQGKFYELLVNYFYDKKNTGEQCPYLSNDEVMKKLTLAKEIIIKNYIQPIKISDISAQVGLNEYRLKEGFKKVYGMTISKFILDFKLEMGKRKLLTREQTVQDISHELGYENPSHFIDAFKKKYQITPKQFMKQ